MKFYFMVLPFNSSYDHTIMYIHNKVSRYIVNNLVVRIN